MQIKFNETMVDGTWMDGVNYMDDIVIVKIEHEIDDYVIFTHKNESPTKYYKAKIHYTVKGKTYFISRNIRHHLDNFIKMELTYAKNYGWM